MAAPIYYLGPPGTFGEQAARQYLQLSRIDAETKPLSSHVSIVQAVDGAEEAFGIVAIENSLGGAVTDGVMEAILASKRLYFRAELVIPIEHELIAAPGTEMKDIVVVMSHSQALDQCRAFLDGSLPGVRLDAALSTAGAVEEAVRTPGAAAIGPRRAAEVYGGAILAEGIQDTQNNKTRFVVLAHEDAPPTGDDKTSLAFTVQRDRPGSLVGVLRHLSERGLNLTRIESRASREELGTYVFFIDFQGHRGEPVAREAIESMKADGAVLLPAGEPLGSYPRFAG